MKVIIIGAGVVGVSTAWHLAQDGHEVQLIDRQPAPALETSFANAGQITVSYSAPWANRKAPWLAMKWMFDPHAPLLLRPQLDWRQWRWCLQFLGQCSDQAYERNFRRIFALGQFSHAALKEVLSQVPLKFQRLQKGVAHFYSDPQSFAAAGKAEGFYRDLGVDRRFVQRDELLAIEPALASYCDHIVGGSYSASDETGNARMFTQALAKACEQRGVQMSFGHAVKSLHANKGVLQGVTVQDVQAGTAPQRLTADAVVLAGGVYTPHLLRTVGLDAPIYPGLGYSASFPVRDAGRAPQVSVIEDKRLALSRLGDRIRVAGTVAVAGYDTSLNTPIAKLRCQALADRIEAIFPGACDTRSAEQGGDPQYWCGLRPATPDSLPLIGATRVRKLWVNAGHGTLGWTQSAGSGKALAQLLQGRKPDFEFPFLGG